MSIVVASMVIVAGAGRVSAAIDDGCALTGRISFDPVDDVTPDEVGVLFEGTSAACANGGLTTGTVLASLSGTFSCLTGNGSGALDLRWTDGSVSHAPATIASVAAGVAALGTVESGPYEGDTVSATLAVAAPSPGCSSAQSTTAPGHGTVYLHPGPLVSASAIGLPAVPPDQDAWSMKDETGGTVDRSIERCATPGDMYHSENSLCKYAQAWVGTRCTRTRQVVTGGAQSEKVCEQKQMVQFAYRGGTSNPKSTKTSRCANSTSFPTDTEEWRLHSFQLIDSVTGETHYTASGHSGRRHNCDTDGPRFYGTPNPVTMDNDHRAEYVWVHFSCGHPSPCQPGQSGFPQTLTFGIGVPS